MMRRIYISRNQAARELSLSTTKTLKPMLLKRVKGESTGIHIRRRSLSLSFFPLPRSAWKLAQRQLSRRIMRLLTLPDINKKYTTYGKLLSYFGQEIPRIWMETFELNFDVTPWFDLDMTRPNLPPRHRHRSYLTLHTRPWSTWSIHG